MSRAWRSAFAFLQAPAFNAGVHDITFAVFPRPSLKAQEIWQRPDDGPFRDTETIICSGRAILQTLKQWPDGLAGPVKGGTDGLLDQDLWSGLARGSLARSPSDENAPDDPAHDGEDHAANDDPGREQVRAHIFPVWRSSQQVDQREEVIRDH